MISCLICVVAGFALAKLSTLLADKKTDDKKCLECAGAWRDPRCGSGHCTYCCRYWCESECVDPRLDRPRAKLIPLPEPEEDEDAS
jgi:hypothetical protein